MTCLAGVQITRMIREGYVHSRLRRAELPPMTSLLHEFSAASLIPAIADSSSDAIFLKDLSGKYVYGNPAFKKIYDDYSDFRRESNLWFRFTEASFDDFMQSQRL
jgi:PAS domain-containing protein